MLDHREARLWNAGVDRACEIVNEWLAEGRDTLELLDRLADAKCWIVEKGEDR